MTEEIYDVIIIGGGPAGLSAAQYAARSQLKTVVLDKSPAAGALALSSRIENYPGLIEPVTGSQLLAVFRNQAVKFGAEYVETKVIGARLDGEIKEVQASDETYRGKTVIIATGAMGRTPGIKGEKEFIGRGVCYCAVCDAAIFGGQTVCVIGNSEEALKETDVIARFAKKVYLISPSKKLKLPDGPPLLNTEKLHIMTGCRALSIEGDKIVEKVKVQNIDTGEEYDIPTNGVFIYLHGSKPIVDFLNSAVDLSDEQCILTNRMMETSIEGVYAAGDVSCTEVRQVVVATANGCMAALSAEKYIHHRKRRKYDWTKH